MTTSLRKRHDDERNWYDAPCCGAALGVAKKSVRVDCPNCGTILCHLSTTLSIYARKTPVLNGDLPSGDQQGAPSRGDIVECAKCGASVKFGSCCDTCDEPTDH